MDATNGLDDIDGYAAEHKLSVSCHSDGRLGLEILDEQGDRLTVLMDRTNAAALQSAIGEMLDWSGDAPPPRSALN